MVMKSERLKRDDTEVNEHDKRCLRRADLDSSVSVVEIPPNNLKRQLVRNRLYDTICTTPNCIICPTGRPGDCLRSEANVTFEPFALLIDQSAVHARRLRSKALKKAI
ncbi:hypothetical protein RB195_024751 [Necator americanus]|uniref:Uncharacterized protein n=1 Tax=Necator americanus TaxID=51031 RepID=A0ABR1EPH5_NECAM